MYSFGPLPKVGKSGRIVGAHQKIDRVARRHFEAYVKKGSTFLGFPDIKLILKFEGINGPDGVKLKSPGVDEPWHFINPKDPSDTALIEDIRNHYSNLVVALTKKDTVRSAFEAAWLAHAVVDGLTPAHHEPEEETVTALRAKTESKRTVRSRLIVSGDGSKRQFVKNNWEHWGAGGVMTTHTMFEAGVASTIKTLKFENARPSGNDLIQVRKDGFEKLFSEALSRVVSLDLYTRYKKRGWTRSMASSVRRELMPLIIKTVTLVWYAAYDQALKRKKGSL